MEVISIERSTYEELLTGINSFVAQMRAMADRGTDTKLGEWLDNQDVCQMQCDRGLLPLHPIIEIVPFS